MSRTIEDRLAAALDARAELVTPQDLRPLEVPATPRRHARAGVLLLAAAATAAVVAAPFLVGGEAGTAPEPEPAAPPSVVATPTEPGPTGAAPSEQPSEPSDGVVTDRQRADVDGDGRPDEVRVLLHGSTPDEPATGTVEVTLASGATGAAEMPFGYPPRLLPAFDVNGDGREQVLMSHTAGGDSAQLLVYTWHEDGLVQAEVEGDAPLALELDGQGTVAHYYVDDRGLFSWRRLDPVDPSGGSRFTAEQWKWSVEGDRLRPAPSAEGCVDVTGTEPPGPC